MIALRIVTGRCAGNLHTVRRLPCEIGRAPGSAIQLEEPGVWDRHLRLELDPAEGVIATLHGEALGAVNGEPFQRHRLRNGDLIEAGGVKLQFWLAAAEQRGLRWRERALWVTIIALVVLETWLVLNLGA
jgi:pSer/pThr/pTyr-binding forkhead associated (FHA) protein